MNNGFGGRTLAVMLLGVFPAMAGRGLINYVETTVDLRPDGRAEVRYVIQWRVVEPELHGFYFENTDRLRIEQFGAESYAVDDRGKRYALSIRRVRPGMWDIVLADGAGVASGTVTYVFLFETDFAEAGYVAPGRGEDGRERVVFDWAPVQWEEAEEQNYYTLRVVLPHPVPQGINPRRYIDSTAFVQTEPFVNAEYVTDYRVGPGERLMALFNRASPGNRYSMRVRFYVPATWFALSPPASDASAEPAPPQQQPSPRSAWGTTAIGSVLGGTLLSVLCIVLTARRRRKGNRSIAES